MCGNVEAVGQRGGRDDARPQTGERARADTAHHRGDVAQPHPRAADGVEHVRGQKLTVRAGVVGDALGQHGG